MEKLLLMIVDDDRGILSSLACLLESAHLQVVCCNRGEDAVKQLANDPLPSLVLLDLMMPGINGHELLIKIKKSERSSKIPVIVFTASRTRELPYLADALIQKPISIESLRTAMSKFLPLGVLA